MPATLPTVQLCISPLLPIQVFDVKVKVIGVDLQKTSSRRLSKVGRGGLETNDPPTHVGQHNPHPTF